MSRSDAKLRKQVRQIVQAHFDHHIASGASWWSFLDPTQNGIGDLYNKAKHEVVDGDSELRKNLIPKITNELTNPDSVFRKDYLPVIEKVAETAAPMLGLGAPRRRRSKKGGSFGLPSYGDVGMRISKYKGGSFFKRPDFFTPEDHATFNMLHNAEKSVAHALPNPNQMLSGLASLIKMMPQKSGSGEPRRKRAPTKHNLAVKALMAKNKGLTLPEASKYVKQHGLAK